jgi:protein ImuB
MSSRFVSIWFPYLSTDWFSLNQPHLKKLPFVLRTSSHGRMVVTSTNAVAAQKGIGKGMALADARAIIPELEVQDEKPELAEKLLKRIAEWCIMFTPVVSVDLPDGLLFDASGCPHLWGGEEAYLADIARKLQNRGYNVRVAIADTIGMAWGMARFGKPPFVVPPGKHLDVLLSLPPEALRLDAVP